MTKASFLFHCTADVWANCSITVLGTENSGPFHAKIRAARNSLRSNRLAADLILTLQKASQFLTAPAEVISLVSLTHPLYGVMKKEDTGCN